MLNLGDLNTSPLTALDGLPVLLPGHDNGLVPGGDGAEDGEALVLLEGLAGQARGLEARGR